MQDSSFVVQEHTTAQGVHWDLMLERGDALTTFRLEEAPGAAADHAIAAEKIFDHPLRFLTYEGPVQQGAGRVRIVDRGACRISAFSEDRIAVRLAGDVLQGVFELTWMDENRWRFSLADPPDFQAR